MCYVDFDTLSLRAGQENTVLSFIERTVGIQGLFLVCPYNCISQPVFLIYNSHHVVSFSYCVLFCLFSALFL